MRTPVVHVVTVPMSLQFLRPLIPVMREKGFEPSVISSEGPGRERFVQDFQVRSVTIEMTRRITPLQDLRALLRMTLHLRRARPAVVHAHTPKAGLLAMIAGRLAGVPVRIYQMRGLPLETARGVKRVMLAAAERVSCALASRVICVGHSVRRTALELQLAPADKLDVLARGSGQGVDAIGRFHPDLLDPATRFDVRREHGIPSGAVVLGFVGRIVRDKGVVELEDAWQTLRGRFPDLHLMMVGPEEDEDPVPADVIARLREDPRVHLVGMAWDMPALYASLDLLTLPTYREGFPNVPLEAAAMRIPVVASRIPACAEAVADGVTGTLVPVRDAAALADAISVYVLDPEMRERHGQAGRERALRDFRPERIAGATTELYQALLSNRELGRRGGDA